VTTIVGNWDSPQAYWNYVTLTMQRHEQPAPWRDQYTYLRAYYWNNGLYEVLRKTLTDLRIPTRDIKGLRNPVFRVVEFYATKLWPGSLPAALPVITTNKALVPAIEQLWTWSNWGTEKQTMARWFPMLGDAFIKCNVTQKQDGASMVWMQNIDPEVVTDFRKDQRGFLTYIRLDTPLTQRLRDGQVRRYVRTEIWDKFTWRIYEHSQSIGTEEEKLVGLIETGSLADLGIDFVPFVWQPFKSVGDERGACAFVNALDKIDEANLQATRLSEMIFRHNRAIWALLANQVDPTGRPMPAPKLPGVSNDQGQETLELTDDSILRIPGNGSLHALVAPINYADALSVLNAQMDELREDMPELGYYAMRAAGIDSGRAARILLDDCHERAVEARSMAEAALVRAHQMCFTLGMNTGAFTGLGTFDAGAFDHSFRERPILPVDEFEEAQTVQTYVGATVPLVSALRRVHWTDDEIAEMQKDQAKQHQQEADLAAVAFEQAQRNFDQNGNGQTQPDGQAQTQPAQADSKLQTGVR
jgi:hypothetical protein